MRILIVSLNFAPEKTGTGKTTLGRAAHLASTGHDVTVLAGYPHYPEWRLHDGYERRLHSEETISGVRVLRRWHHIPHGSSAWGRLLVEASFGITALSAMGSVGRPDVVLGVLPILTNGVMAALLARRFGVPLGIHVQDLVARAAAQSGMKGARQLAGPAAMAERFVLRRADCIAVITEGFRDPILSYGVAPEKVHFVPNWTPAREPALARDDVRQRLNLPTDRPIALYSGNLGNKQGLETLIEAARISMEASSRLLWVLVGDGNQKAELESLAQSYGLDNMRFLPLQTEELHPSVLGAADVLLLTQRASVTDMSFPSKLAGYLASGTPVVAAANEMSDAARPLLAQAVGVVVPPEDAMALYEAVKQRIEDGAGSAELGARAVRFARATYSEASIGRALDGFVHGLVPASENQGEPRIAA